MQCSVVQCWVYFEFALFSLKPYRIDQSCCVMIEMNFHRSVFFQYHTDDKQTLDRPKTKEPFCRDVSQFSPWRGLYCIFELIFFCSISSIALIY
jgi:hypothetical protein